MSAQPILPAVVMNPGPVALQLFRDPIFNLAMLVIALMGIVLAVFWLLEALRTTAWKLHERADGSGPAAPHEGPGNGVHIEEPDSDLRRRFLRRVRLLPRSLSEGRMNDPPWRS